MPAEELLERFELTAKADAALDTLSGGQRQRLALALAFVNRPEIVFLDEPTTGLDPQARRELLAAIARMKADGCTVLLTTHHLDEAEDLCDRVAIIDAGRIVAEGRPRDLVAAGVDAHFHVEAGVARREEDDGNIVQLAVLAQAAADLKPGQPLHLDVQQDQPRFNARHQLQAFLLVARADEAVAGRRQDRAHQQHVLRRVLNPEDDPFAILRPFVVLVHRRRVP